VAIEASDPTILPPAMVPRSQDLRLRCPPEGRRPQDDPEHGLFFQQAKLKNTLSAIEGEGLKTQLDPDYYERRRLGRRSFRTPR
jgi:hypothetical protein